MITSVELANFKAFEKLTAEFHGTTYIVGPNNAGKSTVLNALRSCAAMIRHAARNRAKKERTVGGVAIDVYEFAGDDFVSPHENLRHEFRNNDTELRVLFSTGNHLRALWPRSPKHVDDLRGYFYLLGQHGYQPAGRKDVLQAYPLMGVVPQLSPLDQNEILLEPAYVRKNLDSRLASRHFRNQLYLLDRHSNEDGVSEFKRFLEFVREWTPEIALEDLVLRMGERKQEFDLFYKERGSRTDREVVWAGDGMQIWLQLLLHLFRLKGCRTIVLDEPDVYLHADLQRRLVRLLASLSAQVITSTHSPEILSEADPESIMWVDRTRKNALSGVRGSLLGTLAQSLGSSFNLRLARALRTRHALFVEGQDMVVLSNWAATLGANRVAREDGVAVIPLGGESFWPHIEAFHWLAFQLLEGSVSIAVVLDRDYRCNSQVKATERKLHESCALAHIWQRKELESYVLIPEVIARVSGATLEWVQKQLADIVSDMEHDVSARMLEERARVEVSAKRHRVDVHKEFGKEFSILWKDPQFRIRRVAPKEVLHRLNAQLTAAKKRHVTARAISKAMAPEEIPQEVVDVVRAIEAQITASEVAIPG